MEIIFSNNRLLDSLLRVSMVGYPSDSLASCYCLRQCRHRISCMVQAADSTCQTRTKGHVVSLRWQDHQYSVVMTRLRWPSTFAHRPQSPVQSAVAAILHVPLSTRRTVINTRASVIYSHSCPSRLESSITVSTGTVGLNKAWYTYICIFLSVALLIRSQSPFKCI